MKNLNYLFISLSILTLFSFASCEKADSEKEWGIAKIYMPQANYNPYVVPNSGIDIQSNKNYNVDRGTNKVNIFLGVYRSGLQELQTYSVTVATGTTAVAGTTLLPADKYTLVTSVTCPGGQRDVTFYLSVDLNFLKSNANTNYSLPVTISNPSMYELNESLATTNVRINTSALLTKENI